MRISDLHEEMTMRIEPITGKDKLGRTVVFRAAMPEDAGSRKRTGQVPVANACVILDRKLEIYRR